MATRTIVTWARLFARRCFVHEHFIAAPPSGPIGAVLLAIGLGAALSQTVRARASILVWSLALGFLVLAALDSFPPRQAHLVPVIPAIAILSAAGIVALADQVAGLIRWRTAGMTLVLMAAALAIVGFLGVRNYFTAMPERYPPDLANVAVFEAQAAAGPETVLWVYENADGRESVPWGIEHLPSKAAFKDIGVADLTTGRLKFAPGMVYVIFWTPATSEPVVASLAKITDTAIEPVVHLGIDGRVAGYSAKIHMPGTSP